MRKIYIVFCLLILSFKGFSQDIIILRKNKIEIKSKVSEINEISVKYKKWDNIEGPTYNIQLSNVLMIKYANGKKENFEENQEFLANDESDINQKIRIDKNKDIKVKYPKLSQYEVPYYFDEFKNSLLELESANCTIRRLHVGAWGHVTTKSIQGLASNIRLSKQNNIQFIIQLNNPKANPNALCELNFCEIKGQREFVYSKEGAHGKIIQDVVSINFKKLNDTGLYLITPNKILPKGEYFFSINEQNEVFAFGIDK